MLKGTNKKFLDEKYDSPTAKTGCFLSLLITIILIVLAVIYRHSAISGYLVAIAFVFLIVSSIVILIINGNAKERNYKSFLESLPEIESTVKVISKTSKVSKDCGNHNPIITTYYLSFQFPDNSRKNFEVDVSTYNTVLENETGH